MDPNIKLMVKVLQALVDGILKVEIGNHLDLPMQSTHFWTMFYVLERLKVVDGILMIGPIADKETVDRYCVACVTVQDDFLPVAWSSYSELLLLATYERRHPVLN